MTNQTATSTAVDEDPQVPISESPQIAINENLRIELIAGEQSVVCSHCGCVICSSQEELDSHLAHREGPPSLGGPLIWATPHDFVDAEVVFRQSYCPGCFTAVMTRILPSDHPELRDRVVLINGDQS